MSFVKVDIVRIKAGLSSKLNGRQSSAPLHHIRVSYSSPLEKNVGMMKLRSFFDKLSLDMWKQG